MAYDVKKTDHMYVPFNRFGHALRDSRGNTKIYKDLRTLEQHNKKDDDKPAWIASDFYVDFMEYVPVVRCEDCASGKGSTHKVCPLYKQGLMKDDDFCSKGERKTDD